MFVRFLEGAIILWYNYFMAEATGDKPTTVPKLGFESVLRQQAGTPKSGIRVLEKTGEYNPFTFVERGRVGSMDYSFFPIKTFSKILY